MCYWDVRLGDSRNVLKDLTGQVDLIVTSPPYADARKKHYDSVLPEDYTDWFLSFSSTFYQILKPSGSFVLNLKDKVVNGVRHRYVWRTIDALCDQGWLSIDDYIWHKTSSMPGRWPNRLRDGWEYCFHLSPTKRPYFNPDAVRTPIGDWATTRLRSIGQGDLTRHNSETKSGFGRNVSKWVNRDMVHPSNVLLLAGEAGNKGHPAVFPVSLPEFFVKLLTPEGGLVVDPFGGSGTTAIASLLNRRNVIIVDNNRAYVELAKHRIQKEVEAVGI